jgi:hypothetical protein
MLTGCCLINKKELQEAVDEVGVIGLAFIIKDPQSHKSVEVVVNKLYCNSLKKLEISPIINTKQEGVILDWSTSPGNCSDYRFEHNQEFAKFKSGIPLVALLTKVDCDLLFQLGTYDQICLGSFQPIFTDRLQPTKGSTKEANISLVVSPYGKSILPGASRNNELRGFPFYFFTQACPRRWTQDGVGSYNVMTINQVSLEISEIVEFYARVKKANNWE